jgi:hypothetical protein
MRTIVSQLERLAGRLLVSALAFLPFPSFAVQAQTPEEQTLVTLAPQVKSVCAADVVLRRKTPLFLVDPDYEHHMQALADPSFRFDSLLALLRHSDPKVKTLAIIALYDHGDAKMLPAIVGLADDESPSYSCPVALALPAGMRVDPWPLREQKVGEFASAVINEYLIAAGFHYGIQPRPNYPGFAGYWAARKDRPYSASWFAVRAEYADADALQAIRTEIAALPEPERQWELLWVATRKLVTGGELSGLASEAELLDACKQLGRRRVLQMLAGHVDSSDPDLQLRYNKTSPYRSTALFVLRHSDQLLNREDAAALLQRQDEAFAEEPTGAVDPFATPWWAIGAAQLDHQRASQILHGAMKHFQGKYQGYDRVKIAVALWRLAGPPETKYLLDWFYGEPPCCGTTPRDEFLSSVAAAPHGRQLLAALIRDDRFDTLDWSSLDQLATILDGWTNPPVIGGQRSEAHFPDTPDRFAFSREELEKKYPKETAELLRVLAKWRAQIRASLPAWSRN